MKRAALALLVSCASTFPRGQGACRAYRQRQRVYGAIAAGAGVVAGGAGLQGAQTEDRATRDAVGAGAALSGAVAAAAAYLTESYAADIDRECATSKPR